LAPLCEKLQVATACDYLRFPAISRTCLHLREAVAIAAKERIRLRQGYGGQEEHKERIFSLCAFAAGSFLAFSGTQGPQTFKEQARERHTVSILPRFYGNAKYIFHLN
jgi:hypothetical protein